MHQLLTPNCKAPSTEELIHAIKNKEEAAISTLYDNYAPVLFTIITKIVADNQMAEEALQNVFIKVWFNIESYNSTKGSLFTWLINISRNEAIDVLRSKRYKHYFANRSLESADMLFSNNTLVSRLDDIGFQKLLGQLEPSEKTVIELIYYRGYTCVEIAEILHIPLGTVKTKMQRAYKKLRASFLVKEHAFA